MDNLLSPWRTDEQLEAILAETGNWAISGQQGQVLCLAASLNRAIERAKTFDEAVTLSRLPPARIIVYPAQVQRLKRVLASDEVRVPS